MLFIAQGDDYAAYDYDDHWYEDELQKLGLDREDLESREELVDKVNDKVEEDASLAAHNDDYQIEDNRSINEDDHLDVPNNDGEEEIIPLDIKEVKEDHSISEEVKALLSEDDSKFEESFEDGINDESISSSNKVDEPDSRVIKETKELLEDEISKMVDEKAMKIEKEDNEVDHIDNKDEEPIAISEDNKQPAPEIIKETKDLLKHVSDNLFDEKSDSKYIESKVEQSGSKNDDEPIPDIDVKKQPAADVDSKMEEENVQKEKVVENISAELKDLFEANINSDAGKDEKNFEDSSDEEEDNAYEDLDNDLDKLMDTIKKLDTDEKEISKEKNKVLDYEQKHNRPFGEADVLKQRQNEDDIDADSDEEIARAEKELLNESSAFESSSEELNESKSQVEAMPYGDDSFVADEDVFDPKSKKSNFNSMEDEDEDDKPQKQDIKVNDIQKLTDAEVSKLMKDFVADYADIVNVSGENFDRDVTTYHHQLNYKEYLTITSPKYPDGYPPNTIVDWIFDGDGMGIELNITELNLNGLAGDFLLIKPGMYYSRYTC